MTSSLPWPGSGLVLLAPAGVSAAADRALAPALQLRALPAVADAGRDPSALLAELQGQPPGWLLPLALDPGAWLGPSLCWAEALGAWRQPALLLVEGAAAGSGLDRAYQALSLIHI
jgi:hypothetical protein